MANRDPEILSRIGDLVEAEKQLRETPKLDDEGRTRLQDLEIELDQCWDLLNQRRGLREFGLDPTQAKVRDPDTVEGYQQ